jgi:uncharacterized protein (TIGR02996 family)
VTDADWLVGVAAAPDDPLVRLAYADWLDDRGDPRGELLRLDVQLAALADDDPAAETLRRRLNELLVAADAPWRAAVCRVPVEFDGWVDAGYCDCEVPDECAPSLFGWQDAGEHSLTRQPVDYQELLAMVRAARGCYGRAIRYAGTDPAVIRLLGNDSSYCVHSLQAQSPTVVPLPTPSASNEHSTPPHTLGVAAGESGHLQWWVILLGISAAIKLVAALVR